MSFLAQLASPLFHVMINASAEAEVVAMKEEERCLLDALITSLSRESLSSPEY
jgi:hypothetical protein